MINTCKLQTRSATEMANNVKTDVEAANAG
ncbi:nicotinate-nucleotide--dimethylbenzimidazole phosphoribosyltransferase [Marinobacter sp. ELB17]|nr:nicotinate-nucleotide--dimethylbenzimidazole phosphoribosyltransferase [Marinobacter sp. ELB17]